MRLGEKRNRVRIGDRNMSGRVWAMAGNIAQRKFHGERNFERQKCGILMQSDVKMANQTEDVERNGVRPSVSCFLDPCFLDDFIPQCTEVML
jgi:hypothetical protein